MFTTIEKLRQSSAQTGRVTKLENFVRKSIEGAAGVYAKNTPFPIDVVMISNGEDDFHWVRAHSHLAVSVHPDMTLAASNKIYNDAMSGTTSNSTAAANRIARIAAKLSDKFPTFEKTFGTVNFAVKANAPTPATPVVAAPVAAGEKPKRVRPSRSKAAVAERAAAAAGGKKAEPFVPASAMPTTPSKPVVAAKKVAKPVVAAPLTGKGALPTKKPKSPTRYPARALPANPVAKSAKVKIAVGIKTKPVKFGKPSVWNNAATTEPKCNTVVGSAGIEVVIEFATSVLGRVLARFGHLYSTAKGQPPQYYFNGTIVQRHLVKRYMVVGN